MSKVRLTKVNPKDMSEIANSWHTLSDHERSRAMLLFMPLVKSVSSKISKSLPGYIDQRDLIQSGFVGLADALDKFQPDRGVDIKMYAKIRIRGAILDSLLLLGWVPKIVRKFNKNLEKITNDLAQNFGRQPTDDERAEAFGLNIGKFVELIERNAYIQQISMDAQMNESGEATDFYEVVMDEKVPSPFDVLVKVETKEIVIQVVESLPFRDRLIVSLYFFNGLSMKEISKRLGVSQGRISQKIKQIRMKIAPVLQELL